LSFQLLRPTYPGQMRAIRRNIYNVILVEDLASSRSLQRLTHEVQNMIKQGAPLRFGLVPYLNDQNGPCKTTDCRRLFLLTILFFI
jgi:UDP-glucose:glycoprotein glucosyltransferase